MTALVDASVVIDALRGVEPAQQLMRREARVERLRSSEVVRLEVLAGMRPSEERSTRGILLGLAWHPVDEEVAERAGELGRRWLPANRGIGAADLAIAATAELLGARLLTRNVKHFPMFAGLTAPY